MLDFVNLIVLEYLSRFFLFVLCKCTGGEMLVSEDDEILCIVNVF